MEAHFLDLKNSRDSEAKSAKQVVLDFHHAISNSMQDKIEDHVEEAIIGITCIFCAFGTPQIFDMMTDNVLYLGKRSRRKGDDQEKEVERELSSPNMSILKRASVDIEDFGNSLFNLPFGKFHYSFLNFLNMDKVDDVARYFFSETEFLNSLMDISERLRMVPKANRQKTLIAELTIFNHSLPANVCLPLWCRASSVDKKHHRIVRISPSDAVILNSAERVSLPLLNDRFHFLFLWRLFTLIRLINILVQLIAIQNHRKCLHHF
jgi:hypothetical protein